MKEFSLKILSALGVTLLLTTAGVVYWLFNWSRGVAEDTRKGDSIWRERVLNHDSPYVMPASTFDSLMRIQ